MYLHQNKELKLKIFSTILKIKPVTPNSEIFSTFSSLPFSSPKCHSLHQFPLIGFKKKVQLFCSTNSIVSFFLNSSLMPQWQWRDTPCFQINVLNFFFPVFIFPLINDQTQNFRFATKWFVRGKKKKVEEEEERIQPFFKVCICTL